MEKQNSEQRTVYIGNGDLFDDVKKMRGLLEQPDVQGILIRSTDSRAEMRSIYRPTTPLPTEKDVTKTLRKFLAVIAVIHGGAALTAVKDAKEIPPQTYNFDQLYQKLKEKSLVAYSGND